MRARIGWLTAGAVAVVIAAAAAVVTTQVVFSATDASGAVIVNPPNSNYAMIEVPVIPPGGRAAVGNLVHGGLNTKAAAVTVTPAVTAWLPAGDANNGLAPVTATVVAGGGTRTADGAANVRFTAQGGNCTELLSRGVGVAWRDSAGAIVGGAVDPIFLPDTCAPGGTTTAEVAGTVPNAVPENVDFDRTDITPYCDLQRHPGVVGQSGMPIN